jgi:polysaccharide deacetylase family protein (PEP-CTERM system associated)
MEALMSVDVEEWFHIPKGLDNYLPFNEWDTAQQRVQYVLPRILDLFEKNEVRATFFILGWIAEKHPELVKETVRRGQNIATHGYVHKLIFNQTPDEFRSDIYRSTSVLENLTGRKVIGYRAPGFSITPETEWAFEILAEQGIKYDSSIYPGKRFYGFHEKFDKSPIIVDTRSGEIVEFPQSLIDFGFFKLSCFGGGYFRLFPKSIFLTMANMLNKTGRPLVFYIHPRDIDTDQPQIRFPFLKKVRHYINISKTEQKLDEITRHFDFKSFEMMISDVSFMGKLTHSSRIK